MDDQARQILKGIITKFGASVCDDPSRCESLMRDHMAGYKKEIHLLTCALKEGVVKDLRFPPASATPAVLVPKLVKRLEDSYGLSNEGAKWAVESWAYALGVTVGPQAYPRAASGVKNGTGSLFVSYSPQIGHVRFDDRLLFIISVRLNKMLSGLLYDIDKNEYATLQAFLLEDFDRFFKEISVNNPQEIVNSIEPLAGRFHEACAKQPRSKRSLLFTDKYADTEHSRIMSACFADLLTILGTSWNDLLQKYASSSTKNITDDIPVW